MLACFLAKISGLFLTKNTLKAVKPSMVSALCLFSFLWLVFFSNTAIAVSEEFGVDQIISFDNLPTDQVFSNNASFSVSASSDSGLPVDVVLTSPDVCVFAGSDGFLVLILSAGICELTASQAGNEFFNPAENNLSIAIVKELSRNNFPLS